MEVRGVLNSWETAKRVEKGRTSLLDGIPPAPSGHEKVAITFTYDVNGILNCKTKIVSTGKEALLVVDKSAQRMSEGEKGKAKERLDSEWQKPSAVSPQTSAPEQSSAIVVAARAKLQSVDAGNKIKIESLVTQLERASASDTLHPGRVQIGCPGDQRVPCEAVRHESARIENRRVVERCKWNRAI